MHSLSCIYGALQCANIAGPGCSEHILGVEAPRGMQNDIHSGTVQPHAEQARQHFENAFQRVVDKRNAVDDATYGQQS